MIVKTKTRQSGDVTIVDVAGRVTLGGGSAIFSDTVRELTAGGHKKLLFNLAELAYLDSSGLGELVASLTVATKQGGSLKLLNPVARVKELLKITRVDKLFQVFEDEEAAVRSFA
jgi:anti-sigma B factor antagonist